VQTGGRWRTLAGAVVAGQPKIVEVKGIALEAPFSPVMLFVNNNDQPGFIGLLGKALGDAQINIADFHLGRVAAGEDAIAIVGVDQDVPEAILAKVRAAPQVKYARALHF
jgi:D-3-phosphoglycerate dehydrogenase